MNKLKALVEQAGKALKNLQAPQEDLADLLGAGKLSGVYSIEPIMALSRPLNINDNKMLKELVLRQSHSPEVNDVYYGNKVRSIDQNKFVLAEKRRVPAKNLLKLATPNLAWENAPPNQDVKNSSTLARSKQISAVLARFKAGNDQEVPLKEISKNPEKIIGKVRKEMTYVPSEKNRQSKAPKSMILKDRPDSGQNWFEKRTDSFEASATIIAAKPGIVKEADLKRWLTEPVKDERSALPDKKGKNRDKQIPAATANFYHRPTSSSQAQIVSSSSRPEKIGNTNHLVNPEEISKNTPVNKATAVKPLKGKSQLEMLVNSWQPQKAQTNPPQKAHHLVSDKQHNLLSLASNINYSHKNSDFELTPPERSRAENDHLFAETLERVLKREMDRFGMGEDN